MRVTPGRDYLYRALVPRKVVADVLARKAMNIKYNNFKDSITDKANDRHDAYLRIWWELMNLQRDRAGNTKHSSPNELTREAQTGSGASRSNDPKPS